MEDLIQSFHGGAHVSQDLKALQVSQHPKHPTTLCMKADMFPGLSRPEPDRISTWSALEPVHSIPTTSCVSLNIDNTAAYELLSSCPLPASRGVHDAAGVLLPARANTLPRRGPRRVQRERRDVIPSPHAPSVIIVRLRLWICATTLQPIYRVLGFRGGRLCASHPVGLLGGSVGEVETVSLRDRAAGVGVIPMGCLRSCFTRSRPGQGAEHIGFRTTSRRSRAESLSIPCTARVPSS